MDKNRIAQAHNPVGPTLMFRQLTGREEVSRLFEWQLELLAENNANIRPEDLLGRDITIELQTQTKGSRFLNGQVTRFAFVGKEVAEDTDLWRYEARLSPWLWYLTRESDFRIFQNKTVPDILDEIFGKYPFPVEKRLTGQYRQWEYCVQYQETDFNFVSRLMEGEGIFYFFDHAMGRHTLVLADDVSVLTPCPNGYGSIPYIPHDRVAVADEECVDDVRMWQQIEPGMYVSDDFDFQKPRAELMRRRMEVVPYPQGDHALYQWPGGYTELDDGDNYAKVHLEELQMPRETVMFQCNARGVAAGRLFTLKTCPRKDLNREYVILGTSFYVRDNPYHSGGEGGGSQWRFGVTAQPTSLPYRPQRVTPKPLTSGPQTAIVVGPAGEEIHTDKYGRVKVQFHWDQYGQADEHSSCWIRVSNIWAGANWGSIYLPRIGQEVIVDFIGGDPDLPIITGRVYNADHMPPYELPKYQTYSTIKSRSTKGGGNMDFNELRFVDTKGKEQVFIHANWRMDVRVKWNFYQTVKENAHWLTGYSAYQTAGGDRHDYTKGKLYVHSKGELHVTSKDTMMLVTSKDYQLTATGMIEENAQGHITLESMDAVTLRVGANFVKVDMSGVTIQGMMVNINSGGSSNPVSKYTAKIPHRASEADDGTPGYLDRPWRGGGGGGEEWETMDGGTFHAPEPPPEKEPKLIDASGAGKGPTTPGGLPVTKVEHWFGPDDTKLGKNITIKGSEEFQKKTMERLEKMSETEQGRELLKRLEASGKTMTITEYTGDNSFSGPEDFQKATPKGLPVYDGAGKPINSWGGLGPQQVGTGEGTDVKLEFNPNLNLPNPKNGPMPNDGVLFHEMNHGLHQMGGDADCVPVPGFDTKEEEKTISTGDLNEGEYLKQSGYPYKRTDHDTTWTDNK